MTKWIFLSPNVSIISDQDREDDHRDDRVPVNARVQDIVDRAQDIVVVRARDRASVLAQRNVAKDLDHATVHAQGRVIDPDLDLDARDLEGRGLKNQDPNLEKRKENLQAGKNIY